MSQIIDLGKLRFNWAGEWLSSAQYEVNDIVRHGGNTFVYIYGLKTAGNVTIDTTYWALLQSGSSWQGEYDATTEYKPNQIVSYGANTFIATQDSTGILPTVATHWDTLNSGIASKGDWTASTAYNKDDVVIYGGQTFIALEPHASTASFATDLAASKWSKFSGGFRWTGVWAAATDYKVNDIANNGGATYIVNADHTSTSFAADSANWGSFVDAGTDVTLTISTQGDVLYRDVAGPAALSAGTAGQVLTTAGSNANPSWGYPTLIPWSVLTANTTAVSGGAYIANTTASAFTLTLPSAPADNDHILINDGMGMFRTNNLTIARSGNNIAGLSQDLVCDVDYSSFRLTFKTAIGWILT